MSKVQGSKFMVQHRNPGSHPERETRPVTGHGLTGHGQTVSYHPNNQLNNANYLY